jgi:hypothetical protein
VLAECDGGPLGPRSERGRQDHRLAIWAIAVLRRAWEPGFSWLWRLPPCSADECPDVRGARWSVLAELGRLRDDELIRERACELASWPLETTARQAVAALRAARTGRQGSGAALLGRITRQVASYLLEHPDLERVEAVAAVIAAHDLVIEAIAPIEPDERPMMRVAVPRVRVADRDLKEEPQTFAEQPETLSQQSHQIEARPSMVLGRR